MYEHRPVHDATDSVCDIRVAHDTELSRSSTGERRTGSATGLRRRGSAMSPSAGLARHLAAAMTSAAFVKP
jgi:hypothetical protein